jgi:hypothetical protein
MGLLRDLFGPSKDEIWQQLAAETGAHYRPGEFWTGSKVQGFHGQWTITLDTFTVHHGKTHSTYTRLRAPYVNPDGFRFTIYRKGLFSDLGKLFGMADVEVGHPEFDEQFIIQGNDDRQLVALFANPQVRGLLREQPAVYLTVRDDEGWFGATFPEGVDELYFKARGVIRDVEQLRQLYELFSHVLDQLCRIGSAYDQDPGFVL